MAASPFLPKEASINLKPIKPGIKISSPLLEQRASDSSKGPFTYHYLAYVSSAEAAFVSLDIQPNQEYIVLYEIIVELSLRRKGIATAVVEQVERLALGMQRRQLVVTPEPFMRDIDREVVVRWYTKLGFRSRSNAPQNELWKDLLPF
jgi:GNAT superfamily N-acetyltransferase